MAIAAKALVEFPQREGQQRQGILGFGIGGGLLHEGLLHLQARHPGWALDDRRNLRHRHRRQRHLLEAGGEPVVLGRLQPAEEFRAQGHDCQERQIAAQGRRENPEETLDFFLHQSAEQLLALIDRQQDLRLVRCRRHAEIAGDLRQHRWQRSGTVALQQRAVQFTPVGAASSGHGQGLRQFLARLALGPERRHHQPPSAGAPQPGQHPGPQQGGFSGPRGSEQH